MAVCTDYTVMQLMISVFIIDHLAAVNQCLDVCNEILGVLSQPGHNILKFSEVYMGVDIVCHSLLYSERKAEAFTLVALCSSSLPVGITCACISRDLVPRAARMYQRWSLLSGMMWLQRSQFSRVH